MTQNEKELLDIIRTYDNPQQAMITAIDIMCQYISKQNGDGVPLDLNKQTS